MQLIDTHQHLILRDRLGYGWTDGVAPLAGDFTPAGYRALAGGDVAGTLFMETAVDDDQYRDEARIAAGLARDPATGIRGIVASCRPETAAGFEAWLDECADLGVLGFRRILHTEPDALSEPETFRANLRRLGARGFTFDICVLARQLPLARALAAECPDTALILDHCGVPDIAGGGFAAWRDAMTELARFGNVTCKLSGLTAYCAEGARTLDTMRPYIGHVLEVFGPDRIVWGGDWPVVDTGSGLPAWIAMTGEVLAGLSEAEAEAIGWRNALRVYAVPAAAPLSPGPSGR